MCNALVVYFEIITCKSLMAVNYNNLTTVYFNEG